MAVGCSECCNISTSRFVGISQAASSPREARLAETDRQDFRHQSRLSPVAIGEGMHDDQCVMKSHGDFIHGIRLVFDPVSHVVERFMKPNMNLLAIDAEVFV